MSPEQMTASRTVDARSDIWAIGIILYELLTGRMPFVGETMPEMVAAVLADTAPLIELRSDAPPGLVALVERCLEKDREARFPSVAALATALVPWAPEHTRRLSERISRVLGDTVAATPVEKDGLPAAASPSGGKKTWDKAAERTVIDYVEYTVPSGKHHALVRIPGCQPSEAAVEVAPSSGGDLRGALHSDSPFLVRGPAGNPDWGRAAIALWMPSSIGEPGGTRLAGEAAAALGGTSYAPRGTGILFQPGLVFRWWMMMLELGHAQGTPELAGQPVNKSPEILARVSSADMSWTRAGYRVGVRFPFHYAALGLGLGAGYDNLRFTGLGPGIQWEQSHNMYLSSWALLDMHVFCDWPAHVGVGVEARMPQADWDNKRGTLGLQFGVAYQPNKTCKTERSTPYQIGGRARVTREARR